mgnify:CR=1 FL=1
MEERETVEERETEWLRGRQGRAEREMDSRQDIEGGKGAGFCTLMQSSRMVVQKSPSKYGNSAALDMFLSTASRYISL